MPATLQVGAGVTVADICVWELTDLLARVWPEDMKNNVRAGSMHKSEQHCTGMGGTHACIDAHSKSCGMELSLLRLFFLVACFVLVSHMLL